MIICSCNALSDHDVHKARARASDESLTAGHVHRCLGCRMKCGRCVVTIRRILAEASKNGSLNDWCDKQLPQHCVFNNAKKAEIVRRHLAAREPVANLADEFRLQPAQIHAWVKQVLDRAELAFGPVGRPADDGEDSDDSEMAPLEQQPPTNSEVVAEFLVAYVPE